MAARAHTPRLLALTPALGPIVAPSTLLPALTANMGLAMVQSWPKDGLTDSVLERLEPQAEKTTNVTCTDYKVCSTSDCNLVNVPPTSGHQDGTSGYD
jgi:hypothetical protein